MNLQQNKFIADAAATKPLISYNSQFETQAENKKKDKTGNVKLSAQDVHVYYGELEAIKGIDLNIYENEVIAFIGPSGCGKSTFLRALNRMNDTIPTARMSGRILIDETDIQDPRIDVVELRARVGMVFQKPNPFPKSIFENVAYGPRIHGMTRSRAELEEVVTSSLKRAGLWSEVKDRLHEPGTGLSGGQQQRLCIARTIATRPDLIDRVMWTAPQARLLVTSPAVQVIRWAQSRFPATLPGGVVDSAPLMAPPEVTP